MTERRSYGTGGLYERADSTGRVAWYGKWRHDGAQVKRRIGPKRTEGERDGLTRVQAEAELRRLRAEVRPLRTPGDALTITELAERYRTHLERQGRKRATIVALDSIVRVWLVPFFGDRDLRRVRVEDVSQLVSMMETGQRPGPRVVGDRRYGRPVGVKSVRNYIGTLSALLGFAERKGWITANVAHRIDLPGQVATEEIRFLDPLEVQTLADAATAGPYQAIDRALYLTAAMTGLRQGELCALRWQDVDWPASRIRVRQNYVLGEFGTPKSKRSTRSVPMADQVGAELDRLHAAAGNPADGALVFADPLTGGPLDKAAILRRYRKALKAALLPERHRFHDLRHTFGTAMAAAGVPMRTLQEWMGHRDQQTTMRYADYAPSAQEAAYVAAAFGQAAQGTVRGTNLSESSMTQEQPGAVFTG
jgi:integrase